MVQPRKIVWVNESTIRPWVYSDDRSYFWSVKSKPCGRYSAQPMLIEEVNESLVPSASVVRHLYSTIFSFFRARLTLASVSVAPAVQM
jgi:hypothetical protein